MEEKALILSFFCPAIIMWCPQVTVTPLLTRRSVLNRGSPRGEIGYRNKGGHTSPVITGGDKEKCRKVQKKENNSIISLHTNRDNLNFRLSKTWMEYSPALVS